jgi:glutathione S-transferase
MAAGKGLRPRRAHSMSELTLVIGNKNYSSWSLRPWLVLKQFGIPFTEIRIPLYGSDTKENILRHSPAGKVPVLHDGNITVWDSLAICEYLAEHFPQQLLWPAHPAARALARAICAEMHTGFADMRQHMTMNIRGHFPSKGMTPEVAQDIERIQAIWRDCRAGFGAGGPYLFGAFSIADAFFAPVVLRFVTYAPALEKPTHAYMEALLELPALQEWITAAKAETETISAFELYR